MITLQKRVRRIEIICENLPHYGVVVVVVIETNDISEIEKFGVEISDMFLK